MTGRDAIERLRRLVEQGRFGDARAVVVEQRAALFADLTREEFVALTDLLAVVDQAAEASEVDDLAAPRRSVTVAPQ